MFIAIGALAGSLMMWLAPARFGMEPLLDPLRQLPLGQLIGDTFTLPGLALLGIIGVPHFIAAWLILKRHRNAPGVALLAGIILLGWLALQFFYLFGPNPITNIFTAFAVAEIISALVWRARLQARYVAG
jgi:hypothetical protein